jgi:hypothetical protein
VSHSRICLGGNGIFLKIENGNVIFVMSLVVLKSDIYLYTNRFDEYVRMRNISNEYVLNEGLFLKLQKEFFENEYWKYFNKEKLLVSKEFDDENDDLSE